MTSRIPKNKRRRTEEDGLRQQQHLLPSLSLPEINPLLQHCIMKIVMSYLPVPDIRNCKSVCKNWKSEAQLIQKKLNNVNIIGQDLSAARNLLDSDRSMRCSQLFCKDANFSLHVDTLEKLILFRGTYLHKMTLEKCNLRVCSFENLMLSEAFPHLSFLTLKQNRYSDSAQRQSIFQTVDDGEQTKPVLRYMKILEIDERGPDSETTLRNIAIICPNLVKLSYSNCPVPSAMKSSFAGVSLNQLKQLQMAPIDGRRMSFEYFQALTELKLHQIQTLTLYGMSPGGKKRMKALQTLLKSISSTLSCLHLGQRILYNPEYQKRSVSPFPVALPNLKRISVGPGFFHSLKFLDKCPALTSFTCSRVVADDWTMIIKNKGLPNSHQQMKSLDLGDIHHDSLSLLSSKFPSVCRLDINVSRICTGHDEIVRAICGGFPNLQIFNIYDIHTQNLLTDSGITGLETSECQALGKRRKTKTSRSPIDIISNRTHPYIGDLKCLVDLRLQYISGNLTDISVMYGIKDIKKLFTLDLSKSSITDSSLEVLAESVPTLSAIFIRGCTKVTTKGREEFKIKYPNIQLKF